MAKPIYEFRGIWEGYVSVSPSVKVSPPETMVKVTQQNCHSCCGMLSHLLAIIVQHVAEAIPQNSGLNSFSKPAKISRFNQTGDLVRVELW